MPILRHVFVLLALVSSYAANAQWLTGWDYRKEITLDGADVAGTHANFPVLISMTDPDLAARALANGHDIVFTDNSATAELEHELESYNSGTGELVVWVKIDLTASTDETIYMYYGNASAPDPAGDATDTWDGNFELIYHMDDTEDATTNNRDATSGGTPTTVAAKIGSGQDFDGGAVGTPGHDFFDTNYLGNLTSWTISAWVYADAAPVGSNGDGPIISGESNFNLGWNHSGGFLGEVYFKHAVDSWEGVAYTPLSGSTWYHLSGTYNSATGVLTAYRDGQPINTVTLNTGGHEAEDRTITIARNAGDHTGDKNEWLAAIIDEVQISSVARSDEWLETAYNNQNNAGTGGFIKTLSAETPACAIAAGTITGDATLFSGESTTLTIAGYDGGATLQWQSSSDNSTWGNIGGQTGTTLNTGALGSDTYYRVAVTNGCTNYSPSILVDVEPAFLSGYLFRKKLTLDGTKFTSSQSDFPVVITLIDQDLANHALCSGWDIVFTDESGATLYDHDLDEFNKETGDLTAWLNMDVTTSTDEEVYMYFGNESATDPNSDSDLTWDANFAGVWHLGESGDGTLGEFVDDSGTGNDGRGGNGTSTRVPTQVDGQIGKGQYFDGSDDLINCGSDASLDNLPSFTASAWIKPEANASNRRLFEKRATSAEAKNWYLDSTDELRFVHKGGTEFSRRGDPVTMNVWQHVAMTWTGGMTSAAVDFYINGVEVNAGGSDGATPLDDSGGDFWIGNRHDAARAFIGIIDEMRLSNTVRPADWIALEYSILSDPEGLIESVAAIETSCSNGNGYVNPEIVTIDSGEETSILVFNYEPGATIQWQSSTDGCTWSDVSGATSSALSTGPLTESTKYRVEVTNGCTVYSDLADVTVLPAYAGQKKLTISGDDVYGSSDLTNFPLLVSLTENDLRTTGNGGSVQNTSGYDIVFADASGTLLNHEIISYNASSGAYEAWVQVPTLQHDEDTDIFINYGATGVTEDPSTNGTWNGDYLAVYHLDDGQDATTNNHDLTINGDAAATAGQVGNAFDFDGAGDYLEDADAASFLDGLGSLTMQAWVKSDVNPTNDGFLTLNAAESNDGGTGIRYDAAGFDGGGTPEVVKLGVNTDGTPRNIEGATNQTSTNWTHIVVTWSSGNDPLLYVDGVASTPSGTRDLPGDGTLTNSGALRIGDHPFGEWDGLVDEVRLLGSELSAGWIQTEYFNQDDPGNFITVVDDCVVDAGTVAATNTTVDVDGETNLFLNGYEGGATLQWQISTNGTDFTNIAGSTTDTLNTGALTESRYYRTEVTGSCTNYSDALQIAVNGSNLSGYNYRKKITFTGTEISGDNDEFPALVRIDSDSDLASNVTHVNGYDIVFTGVDGTTVLPHELESYDNATGELVAWVKTDLVDATDKEIYMYYGNSAVSSDQSSTSTWNSDYLTVYHLNDYTDATSSGYDGSNSGTSTTAVQIDDGISLGGADHVAATTAGELKTADEMTISAWVQPSSLASRQIMVFQGATGANGWGGHEEMHLSVSDVDNRYDGNWEPPNRMGFFLGDTDHSNDAGVLQFSVPYTDVSIPHYVTVRVTGLSSSPYAALYLDGVFQGDDVGTTARVGRSTWLNDLLIGKPDDNSRYYSGLLDEVRASTVDRSPDWILTEYYNQRTNSTFMTIGPQEWNCSISQTGNVSSSVASVLSGETATLQLSNYELGTSLQWQSSADGTSFSDIGGATTAAHTTSPITANTYYRVQLNDGVCDAYSDTLSLPLNYNFIDGYSYRMRLTIPADKVSGVTDLDDFPLLVAVTSDSLRSEANGGNVYNDNGYELKFTTLDGTNLEYEREAYSPVVGSVRAWVNIPTLSAASDTEIYLYYGNCSTLADPSSTAAWNSDYRGVYHLDEAGNQDDATSLGYGFTNVNGASTTTAAPIGNGLTFNGSSQRLEYSAAANSLDLINNVSAVTISAWIQTNNTSNQQVIYGITRNGDTGQQSRASLEINATAQKLRIGGRVDDDNGFTSVEETTAGSISSTSDWYHVVGVIDATNDMMYTYVNGTLTGSGSRALDNATSNSNSGIGAIGAEDDGGSRYFNGSIDEVRIARTLMTADWIKTEYDNQSDAANFLTVGEQETQFQWTGATSTTWSTITNWSSCEVPSSDTPIRIPNVSNDPVLSGTVSMSDLTVDAGAVLSLGTGIVTITGDIDNQGVVDGGTSTVNFTGTTDQSISGNSMTLNNAVLNKTGSSEMQVFDELVIDGTLTLASGFIALTGGNLSVTDGTLAGGSSSSFVVTPGSSCLRLTVQNTPTLFALGADQDSYTPAILDNSGVADVFCIRVIDDVFQDGSETGATFDEGVVGRTWLIEEELAGGSDVELTLQWRNADQKNYFEPSNAHVSHYNSGLGGWEAMTSGSLTDVGDGAYRLAATSVTNFSPFGVGSTEETLPVELLFFRAKRDQDQVLLSWATASEINNDFFSIERGTNGEKFEVIAITPGQGTTNARTDYQHVDERPLPGNSYYRLKQTDYDGAFSLSEVVLVQDGVARTPALSIYPNANNGVDFTWSLHDLVPNSHVLISLLDMEGRVLQTQDVQLDGNGVYQGRGFENLRLETGIYLLRVRNGEKEMVSRLIVR